MGLSNSVGPPGPAGVAPSVAWATGTSYPYHTAVARRTTSSGNSGGTFICINISGAAANSDPLTPGNTDWLLVTADGSPNLTGTTVGGVLSGTLPNPAFSTAKVQTLRASAGAFTASQQRDVAFTWATPFADTSYSIVASLEDTATTNQSSALRDIRSKTAAGFTARIGAGTVGYTAGQVLVSAIGWHD